MKIIHLVLGKANPERMNGVNKVAHQLCTTMTELGHNVNLWGIANSLSHDYPARNYPTTLFQQLSNKWTLSTELRSTIQALEKESLVHLHGSFIPEFYHLAKTLVKDNIPYVYTPHGALTQGAMLKSGVKKKIYFRLFESFIIKNAHKVHLLGQGEVSHLESMMSVPNKCMIPNGQIIPDFPKNTKKTENDRPIFGFCGRLDAYHKGLDNLIDGFKLYLDNGNTGKLELIGDGKDRSSLEQKTSAHQLEDHITFHGARFGDEKYTLLSNIDLFMHPSRMEGFPTAVLEAAALGRPCITSEATNINAYINNWDAGITFGESTAKNVASAMEKANSLFKNKRLRSMGDNAYEMVIKEFSWRRISTRLLSVYES